MKRPVYGKRETGNEWATFEGVRYSRNPKASLHCNRYFIESSKPRHSPRLRLHRAVWVANFGPIPKGYDVHHMDENQGNCDPDNLEIMTRSRHILAHPENIKKAQMAARAWHSTPKGVKWHSEQGKRGWRGRLPSHAKTCTVCGHSFMAFFAKAMNCSKACKAEYRRRSGVDDIKRRCAHCGKAFTINKFRSTKCCSGSCAAYLRQRA